MYSNVYSAAEERTNTVLFFTSGTFYTFLYNPYQETGKNLRKRAKQFWLLLRFQTLLSPQSLGRVALDSIVRGGLYTNVRSAPEERSWKQVKYARTKDLFLCVLGVTP